MIVNCPQCQTGYKLDAAKLAPGGTTVRCTTCQHMWTQAPPPDEKPTPETNVDIVFEAQPAPPPPAPPPPESFKEILQQVEVVPPPPPAPKMPDVLKPKPLDFSTPAPITYKVMGMGPGQFGLLSFLLCLFVTAILLFQFNRWIVHAWPVFSGVYRTMGFDVKAPGEGLRIDGLTVENRVDKGVRVLSVEAKLTNITDHEVAYPALRLSLKSAYGAVLKTWDSNGKGASPLASGASVPVKWNFSDAPDGGESVEIRVTEP